MEFKFSIIYATYRPGSFDLLLSSILQQTYKNYELIIVDDYPRRPEILKQVFEFHKIPLKYFGQSKQKCYDTICSVSNAINTGAILSSGDVMIIFQDYTYFPSDALENWNIAFNDTGLDTIICGGAKMFTAPIPQNWHGIFSAWQSPINEDIIRLPGFSKKEEDWIPEKFEAFYTGIPRKIMEHLNGFDEYHDDHCDGGQVHDFFERAMVAGYKVIVNRNLLCHMIDHRSWHPPDSNEDHLWYVQRFANIRSKPPMGMTLNELVQAVREGKKPIRAQNCFDMYAKEQKLQAQKSLKIALISTPFFGVPPKRYGGLEQIVWDLAEALDELGHEVTIFAPEDSQSPRHGHLITTGPSISTVNVNWFEEEKRGYNIYKDTITPEKFDLIHDHTWFGFPYLLKGKYPNLKILHTNHGGYSWESAPPVPKPNLVALSNYMKIYTEQYFKQIGYNIHSEYVRNGINIDKYPFNPNIKKTDRLLFVGRLSTFKQPHVAVEVARKTNHKLDILGGTFVDSIEYVNQLDKMVENDPNIKIYKDVSHEFKIEKMQNAKVLIFPSNMGEPAGLCLLPDSPILSLDRGVQKIKDIKIGDKVLTHKGRFMRVSQTMKRKYSGDMIRIVSHKLRIPLILTPEHKVLCIKTQLCTNKGGGQARHKGSICLPGKSCYYMKDGERYKFCKYIKGEEPYTKYKTQWIDANDLQVGDMVVYPKVHEKEIDIDKIELRDYVDDFLNIHGYDKNQHTIFDYFDENNERKFNINKKIGLTNRFKIYEGSEIPAEINVTKDLMRLFGYYIAEGCTKADRQVQFSFNSNEDEYINDVEKLMKEIFELDAQHTIEYQGEHSHTLTYSNKILSNIFQNMFSPKEYINDEGKGRKAHIVRIPSEFLNLPSNKLSDLIKGEWRGDGTYLLDSKNKNNRVGYQMKTTSETLAHQLFYILSKFDILSSIRIDNSRSKHNKNCVPQYLLEIQGKDAIIFNKIIEDDCANMDNSTSPNYISGKNYFYFPIKELNIIKHNGEVYNIEVEEDNSYVSSIIIHNCALEAMSCGTPVIAFDDGAIKEYVIHNKTGFICNSIDEMVEALNKIHTIKPEDCRKRAIGLSREKMAENYVRLYNRILQKDEW